MGRRGPSPLRRRERVRWAVVLAIGLIANSGAAQTADAGVPTEPVPSEIGAESGLIRSPGLEDAGSLQPPPVAPVVPEVPATEPAEPPPSNSASLVSVDTGKLFFEGALPTSELILELSPGHYELRRF